MKLAHLDGSPLRDATGEVELKYGNWGNLTSVMKPVTASGLVQFDLDLASINESYVSLQVNTARRTAHRAPRTGQHPQHCRLFVFFRDAS